MYIDGDDGDDGATRFEKWTADSRNRVRCRSCVYTDDIGVFAHIDRDARVQRSIPYGIPVIFLGAATSPCPLIFTANQWRKRGEHVFVTDSTTSAGNVASSIHDITTYGLPAA